MAQLQSTGITGSLTVTTGSATEFLVTNTGVRIGNVISDTHSVTGSLNISGSFNVNGTITAQTLVVQTITSSQSLITGSTIFGQLGTNTHQFTGSLRVSGSGNHWILGGNVGIGSAVPAFTLDVAGNIGMNGRLFAFNSATYTQITDPAGGIKLYLGASGDPGNYYDNTSHNFRSIGGSTTYVTINSGGNVGIGTTNPGQTLHVYNSGGILGYKTARFDSNDTGNGTRVLITNSGNTSNRGYALVTGGSGGVGPGADNFSIGYYSSDSTYITQNMFFINSNGSVGIGNTSPSALLQIGDGNTTHASSRGFLTLVGKASDWNYISFYSGSTYKSYIGYDSSGYHQWYSVDGVPISLLNASVGIGTTNPGAKLDVRSQIQIKGDTNEQLILDFTAVAGNYTHQSFRLNGVNKYRIFGYVNGDFAIYSDTGSAYVFYAKYDGNVGIGSTAPASLLDVAGTIRSTTSSNVSGLTLRNTTAGSYSQIGFDGDTADAYIFKQNSTNSNYGGINSLNLYNEGPLAFHSNTTSNIMTITAAGSVGIGTTAPTYKLDVAGDTNGNSFRVYSNNAAGPAVAIHNTSTGGKNWQLISNGSSNADGAGRLQYWNSTDSFTAMTLGFSNTTITNLYTPLYVFGSVGIGTTSLSSGYRLSVSGSIISTVSSGNTSVVVSTSNANGAMNAIAGVGLNFNTDSTNKNITFAINSGEVVRINSAGSVGIGTTAPAVKLHVYGSAVTPAGGYSVNDLVIEESGEAALGIIGTTYSSIYFGDAGTALAGAIVYDHSDNNLGFRTNGNSEKMRIASNGNVGIGTDNPTSAGGTALVIYDSTTARAYWKNSSTNTYGGGIAQFSDDFYIFNSESGGNIYFQDAASTRVTFASGGKVGIGTTAPTNAKVHIIGDASYVGDYGYNTLRLEDSSGYPGLNYRNGNINWLWRLNGADNSFEIVFSANASAPGVGTYSPYIKINSSGNVGIGTTSPINKLHIVEGTSAVSIGEYNSGAIIWMDGSNGDFVGSDYFSIRVPNETRLSLNYVVTEVLSVTSGSSVGIGTTSPTAPLDTFGVRAGRNWAISNRANIRLDSNGTSFPADILFGHTAAANETSWTGVYWSLSSRAAENGNKFTIWRGSGQPSPYNSEAILFTIQPDGNIGIGTTSPAGKLDIAGGSYNTSLIVRSNNVSGTGINLKNTDTGGHDWYIISTASGNSGGAGNLGFYDDTNGNYLMYIKGADGNVGIGTINPLYRLDVFTSTSNTAAQIRIKNTFANVSADAIMNVDGYGASVLKLWRNGVEEWKLERIVSTDDLQLSAYGGAVSGGAGVGTVQFWDYDTGNVGIGTTLPSAKLHVRGNTYISASAAGNPLVVDGLASGWVIFRRSGKDLYLNANYSDLNQTAQITPAGASNMGLSLSSREVEEDLYITGSTGFVGIGTKVPNANLHIYRAGQPPISDGLYGNVILDTDSTANYQRIRYDVGATPYWGLGREGSTNDFILSGRIGSTWTDGAFKIQQSSGNVGINTTAPVALFHVNNGGSTTDTFYVNIGNSPTDTLFEHTGAGTPVPFRLRKSGYSGAALNYGLLYLHMNDNTVGNGCALYFTLNDSAGNEHEYGGIGTVIASNTNGAENGHLYFMTSDSGTTRSEKMRIISNGNVGIGTTTPIEKLHVVGSVHVQYENNSAGFGGYYLGEAGSRNICLRQTSTGKNFVIDTYNVSEGWVARMTVLNSGGNVGIGSGTPAYRLDVTGTIRASADVIAYSDARVKTDVVTVENALEKVKALRGVTYTRTDNEDKSRKLGVIAQEVLPILPEVVQQDSSGNYSVAYGNMVGVLIEAIKEQQRQIDDLKYLLQTQNK